MKPQSDWRMTRVWVIQLVNIIAAVLGGWCGILHLQTYVVLLVIKASNTGDYTAAKVLAVLRAAGFSKRRIGEREIRQAIEDLFDLGLIQWYEPDRIQFTESPLFGAERVFGDLEQPHLKRPLDIPVAKLLDSAANASKLQLVIVLCLDIRTLWNHGKNPDRGIVKPGMLEKALGCSTRSVANAYRWLTGRNAFERQDFTRDFERETGKGFRVDIDYWIRGEGFQKISGAMRHIRNINKTCFKGTLTSIGRGSTPVPWKSTRRIGPLEKAISNVLYQRKRWKELVPLVMARGIADTPREALREIVRALSSAVALDKLTPARWAAYLLRSGYSRKVRDWVVEKARDALIVVPRPPHWRDDSTEVDPETIELELEETEPQREAIKSRQAMRRKPRPAAIEPPRESPGLVEAFDEAIGALSDNRNIEVESAAKPPAQVWPDETQTKLDRLLRR